MSRRTALLLSTLLFFIAGCAVDSSNDDRTAGTPSSDSGTQNTSPETTSQVSTVRIERRDGIGITVAVEVAETRAEQLEGLTYRPFLDEFAGMLFVFSVEDNWSFTMENTLIPLDMIHIDAEQRIVGIIEYAAPNSVGPYIINTPSLYVLEVNGGFAERHGVAVGDRVSFRGGE